MIPISTIGFTKTNAENFFGRLVEANVKKVIDVRLNNTSQLSGFAKAKDLSFFLEKIGGIRYTHQPMLAPTDSILKEFKKNKGPWGDYERKFLLLMESRKIEEKIIPESLDCGCLLCSEDTAHYCHRRLVLEYLNSKWDKNLKIKHL